MKLSQFKVKYIVQNQTKIKNIQKYFLKFGLNKRLNYSYSPSKITFDLNKALDPLFNISIKKRNRNNRIKFLIRLKSFRGSRHKKMLPCRGQRTHTNAKTNKNIRYGV